MRFVASAGVCFGILIFSVSYASKFDLECQPISYRVVPELNKTLGENEIRAVTPTLAGFLDTETYSLKVTTECEGKREDSVCISISDENYCPKTQDSFRIRGVGKSGDTLMVKNRCTDVWAKYTKISKIDDTENFIADEVYFQLKNQIYVGVNIADKPILKIGTAGDEVEVPIEVVSFSRDLWHVNEFDPLVGVLKANTEHYEQDDHFKFNLIGQCKPRS